MSSATWSLCNEHFSQLANWNFHRPFVHARFLYILVVILLKFHPLLNNFSFFVKRLFFSSFYLSHFSFFLSFFFFNFWAGLYHFSIPTSSRTWSERTKLRQARKKEKQRLTRPILLSFFFLLLFFFNPACSLVPSLGTGSLRPWHAL